MRSATAPCPKASPGGLTLSPPGAAATPVTYRVCIRFPGERLDRLSGPGGGAAAEGESGGGEPGGGALGLQLLYRRLAPGRGTARRHLDPRGRITSPRKWAGTGYAYLAFRYGREQTKFDRDFRDFLMTQHEG